MPLIVHTLDHQQRLKQHDTHCQQQLAYAQGVQSSFTCFGGILDAAVLVQEHFQSAQSFLAGPVGLGYGFSIALIKCLP